MPSLNNLLTKWKLWINRDHTFQADELKELQSHLMEEINYLVNQEGLSEEEAFHKAVSLVGEREGLDQEYVKVKSAPSKVMHWVKLNNWSIILLLFLTCVLLVTDLIYSSSHFVDVYEPLDDQYYYSSEDRNSYSEMSPIKDKKIVNITPNCHIAIKNSSDNVPKAEYIVHFKVDGKIIDSDKFSLIFPEGTLLPESISAYSQPKIFGQDDIWESKSVNRMTTNPVLIGRATIFNANYKFVYDNFNQLWLVQYSKFQINSPRILLKTQNLESNKFILDKRYNEETKNHYFFADYPQVEEDSNFMFFTPLNPYQIIFYQKEIDKVRTIRLQLIKLADQKNPILVWDEVSLVHKPIHLWDLFIFPIERHFRGETNVNS
jgi:hypothetical protein